jgi:hypothetical protein
VLNLSLLQLGLIWNRVDEALSFVRIFDRKIEDALVVDLEELGKIFWDQEVLAPLDPCRGQLYGHC